MSAVWKSTVACVVFLFLPTRFPRSQFGDKMEEGRGGLEEIGEEDVFYSILECSSLVEGKEPETEIELADLKFLSGVPCRYSSSVIWELKIAL